MKMGVAALFLAILSELTQAGDSFVSPPLSALAELHGCEPPQVPVVQDGGRTGEENIIHRLALEAHLNKVEVFARLIYSESLSTGYWARQCSVDGGPDLLFSAIGWAIANRVKEQASRQRRVLLGTATEEIPKSAVYDTVFRPNHFRTSFSGRGRPNPFAQAFLCPLKSQEYLDRHASGQSAEHLFSEAWSIAAAIMKHLDQGRGVPAPFRYATNFFYPRSERYGDQRPPWASSKDPRKNKGYLPILAMTDPCVEFYGLRAAKP